MCMKMCMVLVLGLLSDCRRWLSFLRRSRSLFFIFSIMIGGHHAWEWHWVFSLIAVTSIGDLKTRSYPLLTKKDESIYTKTHCQLSKKGYKT